MIRRLPLVVGALALAGFIGKADAGRFAGGFHAGGGFRGGWSAGVHVSGGAHWSTGYSYSGYSTWHPSRWYGGGHIYVGYRSYYPWWPSYYYYYPEYVPSYYGASYYPVQTYAAPGVTEAYVPPPPLPKLGIGVFGGAVDSDLNQAQGVHESDFGLLGRYRLTPGLIVEGELGKTSYNVDNQNDPVRVDRRMGGSLIYELGAYNSFAPYVLGGLGVQQSDVGGSYKTTQDYAEVGIGLRLAVTRNVHITFDVRAGSRSTVSNDSPTMLPPNTTASMVAPPPTSSPSTNEDYTRARLAAILYF